MTSDTAETRRAANRADPRLGAAARHFWRIPPRGWWNIAQRVFAEAGADNLNVLAAGIAFFAFLSLAPLLAAITLIYGLAASPADVAAHIGALSAHLPADAAGIIRDQLLMVTAAPAPRLGVGLAVSIALAIYGVTRASGAILAALNVVYDEAERRSFIRLTLITYGFAAAIVAVGILVMIAIALLGPLAAAVDRATGLSVAGPMVLAVAAVAATLLIAAIYRYGPSRDRARWSWLTPGAIFALLAIAAVTSLFGLYATRVTDFQATYGALGSVAAFLMWLFFCAYGLLIGAELNAEVERQTARDTTEGPHKRIGTRGAEMADQVNTSAKLSPEDERS